MSFVVGSILGDLELDDKFSDPLKKAVDGVTGSLSAGQYAFTALATAAAAATTAIVAMTVHTANSIDATTKAAASVGLTTEAYGKLQYAAELSDVSTQTLTKALTNLRGEKAAGELTLLCISMFDVNGKSKDSAQLLGEVAQKMEGMSVADKAAVSVALFGTKGRDMVNMLTDGKKGLDELGKEAEDLGIIFDSKTGKQAALFNDNLKRLTASSDGLVQSIGKSVISFVNETGAVVAVTNVIAGLTKSINSLSPGFKDAIIVAGLLTLGFIGLVGAVMAFTALEPVLVAAGPLIGAALDTALGPVGVGALAITALVAAITFMVSKWFELKQALAPIQPLFDTLKKSVLDMVNVVEGPLSTIAESFKKAFSISCDGLSGILTVDTAVKSIATGLALAIGFVESVVVQIKQLARVAQDTGIVLKNGIVDAFKQTPESLAKLKEAINNLKNDVVAGQADLEANAGRTYETIKKIWATPIVAPPLKVETEGPDGTKAAPRVIGASILHDILDGFATVNTSSAKSFFGGLGKDLADSLEKSSKEHSSSLLTDMVEKMRDLLPESGMFSLGSGLGTELGKGLTDAISDVMKDVGEIIDKAVANMLQSFSVKIAKAKQQAAYFDELGQLQSQQAEKAHKQELADITKMYDGEVTAAKKALIAIEAINNKSVQDAKKLADAKLAADTKQLHDSYLVQLATFNAKTKLSSERTVGDVQLQKDMLAKQAALQKAHDDAILDAQTKASQANQQASQDEAANETAINDQKNAALADSDQKYQEAQKEAARKNAEVSYAYQLYEFAQSQMQARTQARMDLAKGDLDAVLAGAKIVADLGIFGIPIGAAMTAALLAETNIAYAQANALISANIPPMPPPALTAETGGLLVGPSHAQGGIDVNAQGGEFIMNAAATANNLSLLQQMNSTNAPIGGAQNVHVMLDIRQDEGVITKVVDKHMTNRTRTIRR